MRAPASLPIAVLAALLLGACQGAPTPVVASAVAARTASVRVTPSVREGGVRQLLATMAPYTQASIAHMVVELLSVAGAVETPITSVDVAKAQLGQTITFGNLAHATTYRIRAHAYFTADTSQKISDDATSSVDVVVGLDDAPPLGNLVVSLIDQTFAGTANSGGLTVDAGEIVHGGAIAVTAHLPTAFNTVSTLAGSVQGLAEGNGAAAKFDGPTDAAVDAAGNVYVTDQYNHTIRKIEPDGDVTTFAGSGFGGSIDGTGAGAAFSNPVAITIDRAGNLFVIDARCVRKVTPGAVVTTVAGDNGQAAASVDGTGGAARFYGPDGIAAAPNGDLWVTDRAAHRIRKVTQAGVVTTVAGNGPDGSAPNPFADGNGAAATFAYPSGVAVDRAGNAFVADWGNNRIRKVEPDGDVTTFAGSGASAVTDGTGAAAAFAAPAGVAFDRAGHLLVTEATTLRRVSPLGAVITLAGAAGATGTTDGTLAIARFDGLLGVASAPDGTAYVVDGNNHRVRKLAMIPL